MKNTKNTQRGLATVEFALVGPVLFMVLFGVIEISRAFFVWNTMAEATRRGARVAAVCPANDNAIRQITVFSDPNSGDNSPVVSNLSVSNVDVKYYANDGTDTGGALPDTKFVQVQITGYQHTMLIPFVPIPPIPVPPFSTTLPVESMGWIPEEAQRRCVTDGV